MIMVVMDAFPRMFPHFSFQFHSAIQFRNIRMATGSISRLVKGSEAIAVSNSRKKILKNQLSVNRDFRSMVFCE